jgi:non-specific serine/threonine protein kinase
MVATASRRVDALPADTSRLIGRRPETTAIRQLLSLARLVTLTGVGGVGKTRLAVNVARQLRPAFPGGTFVVPLAELATPELLPTAVMSRLSRTGAASAGLDELAEHIGDRDLLVVLDNCEHLAADCAALVGELLRRCPALRVLATSRERLRVDGEAVYACHPSRCRATTSESWPLTLRDTTPWCCSWTEPRCSSPTSRWATPTPKRSPPCAVDWTASPWRSS